LPCARAAVKNGLGAKDAAPIRAAPIHAFRATPDDKFLSWWMGFAEAREPSRHRSSRKDITMRSKLSLKGSITALVTPFKNGGIDEEAFRAHVDWQIKSGTTGLVPVGTTGESPTLSHEEHRRVVELCVEEAKGRVPVVAGAGSNNTREAVELARHAEKVGADAVLVVTPYYNKPTQEGLYQHFKAVNDAIGIPIIIYNIPPRSVVDMSVDTMRRLYELKNIAGVKDATANLARVSLQRQAMGPDFIQLSGEDMMALASIAAGGHGCVSVVANVAPAPCAAMHEACASGNYAEALRVQDRLTPLHAAIFLEPGVSGAKHGLSLLGRCEEKVRLPLLPVSRETGVAIKAAMVHAGLLNA
jgi:4-hydroxy-tetrahydrodipicolinate synthase